MAKDRKKNTKEASVEDIENLEEEIDLPSPESSQKPDEDLASSQQTDEDDEEEREEDQYSEDDKEERVRLYNLFIPRDKTTKEGNENPGFAKLCLDRDFALGTFDTIRFILLERTRPREVQVPYDQRETVPADRPWERLLACSLSGNEPSMDEEGNVLKLCKDPETGTPFAICSQPSEFDDDGVPIVQPLKQLEVERNGITCKNECAMGRWGNTLTDEDRAKFFTDKRAKFFDIFGEEDHPPVCDKIMIWYCWSLDLNVPFKVKFKSFTAVKTADEYLAQCVSGFGPEAKKLPFHRFIGHLSVADHGNYYLPLPLNTKEKADKKETKPIVDWWRDHARKLLVSDPINWVYRAKKDYEERNSFDTDNL